MRHKKLKRIIRIILAGCGGGKMAQAKRLEVKRVSGCRFYVFIIICQLLGILSSMQISAIHGCFPKELKIKLNIENIVQSHVIHRLEFQLHHGPNILDEKIVN